MEDLIRMEEVNIIVASGNLHKIKEVKAILAPLGYNIKSMEEAGIDIDILEDGKNFEENALIKARALATISNEIVVADDSGLEVEILDNAPGIYSARYAGEHGNDKANNHKLLRELKNVPEHKRGARFYCAIAMVYPSGKEIVVAGECKGIIGLEPKGSGGFGYDPLFFIPQLGKTYAQLDPEEKNNISHRSRALDALKKVLLDR
jgi:XTP/dITP diphosphohydrolase